MPNELNEVRRLTNDIQRISVEPAIGQSYLDEINYEVWPTKAVCLMHSKVNDHKN